MMVFGEATAGTLNLWLQGTWRRTLTDCQASLPSLRSCIDEDPMYCWSGIAELFRAASREQQPQRVFSLSFLSSERMTSLKSSTLLFVAFAPAPVSSETVSRPLITRWRTPTLKKEMNFSWLSISLLAAEGGLHSPG